MIEEPCSEVIDIQDLRRRLENDEELIAELLELFVQELPSALSQISDALNSGEGKTIVMAAHALKGAAANISATAIKETARALEAAGEEGNITHSKELHANLVKHVEKLNQYYTNFIN